MDTDQPLTDKRANYNVIVNDNFHYQDPGAIYTISGFPDAEAALAECLRIIDCSLKSCAKLGRNADVIYDYYIAFGEDPWVDSPPGAARVTFSAWDYAKENAWRYVILDGNPN